jgi:hypothetical protein
MIVPTFQSGETLRARDLNRAFRALWRQIPSEEDLIAVNSISAFLAKIDSEDGGGAYTITGLYGNSGSTTEDTNGISGTAYEIAERDDIPTDTVVIVIEAATDDGGTEFYFSHPRRLEEITGYNSGADQVLVNRSGSFQWEDIETQDVHTAVDWSSGNATLDFTVQTVEVISTEAATPATESEQFYDCDGNTPA